MHAAADIALLLVVLTDFAVLSTSRLSACIRFVAAQGLLLGVLPLASFPLSVHTLSLAVGTAVIKAGVLPWLLDRAIRDAAVRRELEPRVGYLASIGLGVLALAIAFSVVTALPAQQAVTDLLIPVALATVMIGLIVLITRRKAVVQVVGYLMLENGIYLFGFPQIERVPFLVEIGVLLDVFVGVFIMGIVMFHINREFDSISAAQLTELRE